VFRHRKLVHKGAAPLADLLPVESGDSQDAMGEEVDMDYNGLVIEESRSGQVMPMEEDEVDTMNDGGEYTAGVYVVNPEPVDDDVDVVDDVISQPQSSGMGGMTLTYSSSGSHQASGMQGGQQQQRQAMFKCRMCPYTNPYKWKIAQHARTVHMRKTLFRCAQCDFTCERKIEWCVHKTKHSKKVVHSCDECAYSTTMKRNFDRHMRRHSNGGPIKCSLCTYASTGEAAVQRHMAEFHHNAATAASAVANGNGNGVKPSFSQASSSSVSSLFHTPPKLPNPHGQHLNQMQYVVQSGDDENEDEEEEDSGSNRSSPATGFRPIGDGASSQIISSSQQPLMRLHELTMLKNLAKSGSEAAGIAGSSWNMKQCDDQPLDLSKKDTTVTSWPSVIPPRGEQPLDLSGPGFDVGSGSVKYVEGMTKCPHCNYSASWPSDLQRHMMVHSVERRCHCHLCGRRYKHQFDLNSHLRRVHHVMAGRSAVQGFLASSSADNVSRDGHVLSSVASGPARTHPLPVSFSESKATALNHEPRLSPVSSLSTADAGEKLRCEFCNYVGKYRAEVERHMRLHTGDKPFACLFCTYRSFWKGDMKRHLVKHHPAEVDSCPDLKVMVNDTERLGQQLAKEDNLSVKAESSHSLSSTEEGAAKSMNESNREEKLVVPLRTSRPPPVLMLPSSSFPFMERQVFKCSLCPFQCDAPSKLKCHGEIHANLKRFKCPECGKRSNWTWDIRKHIRKDHPNMTLEVIEMSEEEAKATLSDYVSTHRTCGRSNAESSKESTPVRENLQRLAIRMQAAKYEEQNSDSPTNVAMDDSTAPLRPFKCSECPKRSNWKWDIQKHIRAAHAGSGGKVIVFKGDRVPANRSLASKYSPNKIVQPSSLSLAPYNRSLKPLSLQPSDLVRGTTERCRPFKCSECGKRSNWKWDLNKHIAAYHNNEAHIVTLTDEEARDTFDEYLRVQQKDKSVNVSVDSDDMVDFSSEGNVEKHVANLNVAISLLAAQNDESGNSMLLAKDARQQHLKDTNKTKKFKCSVCAYRSNFRSDIQRHIKRRHGEDMGEGAIIELSDKEAAETLADYHKTCGVKKFSNRLGASNENGVASDSDDESLSSKNDESARSNALSDDESSFYQNIKNGNDTDSRRDELMDDAEDEELWIKVPASDASAAKGRGRHFCEWCPYVSINRNDYIYHKQFHHAQPSATFKCDQCPYWVTQKRLLKQHEKVHQLEYKLRYYPSSRLTTEQKILDSDPLARSNVTWSLGHGEDDENLSSDTVDYEHPHLNGNNSNNAAGNSSVGTVTQQPQNAGLPSTVSPPTSGLGKSYKCRRCPYVCGSFDRLMEHKARHILTRDDEGRPVGLSCSRCDYRATSDESLSVHGTVHVATYRPGIDIGSDAEEGGAAGESTNEEEWKCDQCPYHTMLYTRYEKHLLSHRSSASSSSDVGRKASSKSLVDDSFGDILSAMPADIAAAANLMTGGALMHLMDNDADIGDGEPDEQTGANSSDAGTHDYHRGAAIFPGHAFDELNAGHSSTLSYDLNANVANKSSNGISSS
jgi:hypothetical protein